MDGGDRRASQYAAPYQTPTQGRPAPGQPMGPPTHDRYGQPIQSPARTDIGRSSTSRSFGPGYGAYGYQDPSFNPSHMESGNTMPGVEMQYSGYVQDPSRSHMMHQPQPHQQYPTYTQSSMLPPMQQQSMFEAMPHFQQQQQQQQQQQRQSTDIGVLAGGFGMPPYMQHGEHGGVGAVGMSSHYITTQPDTSGYTTVGLTRPSLQPPFSTVSTEFHMRDQRESQEPQEQDHVQEALEADMRRYEQQLRLCFETVIAGRVSEASEKLLELSKWLLTSVVPLELHHDDMSKYDQRLRMWLNFNHCWEALGQKQKDITQTALQTRHVPADILSADAIEQLMEDFMTLCDQIEQYGLVDYEMGVWEEQISSIFGDCLDLLRQPEIGSRDESTRLNTR